MPQSAYVYAADLYCEECGGKICDQLTAEGKAPENQNDETTFDSDVYPKGPYSDAGGPSDSPQHCGGCGKFLENELTADGYAYVVERLEDYAESCKGPSGTGLGNAAVLCEWAAFYLNRKLES